jgi:Flp pilus assembly protein TadG
LEKERAPIRIHGKRVSTKRAHTSFADDQRGATALEFSLVAVPLFFLLFGILELGLIFVLSLNLSNAAASLGRQLRVGQVIAPGSTVASSSGTRLDLSDFKTAICNKIGLVPTATCMSQLQVDVRTLSSFQNQSPPNPISGGTFSTSSLCYYSGQASSVVEFRAYYLWPIVTPVLLSGLVNVSNVVTGSGTSSGSWFAVSATEVFKNEPSSSITNTSNSC